MNRSDPPRQAAYDVVFAVDQKDAYANLLLPRTLTERGLTGTDAAFATELTYGTLRRQGVLDEIIAIAAKRDVIALDAEVRCVLRLGAYQLLHMRVPAHAAVHSAVELARAVAGPRVVGFVNAVLRAIGRVSWDEWIRRLAPHDDLRRIAVSSGYPEWVAEALLDALGGDHDELRAALANDRPTTHLVARPGRITREELIREVGPAGTPGPWSPYAVHLSAGDPGALASVRSGSAAVQDEGSQLIALALANARPAGADRWWGDLCAGPGGKAAMLAGLLPAGSRLLAADIRPHRARLVADALADRRRVVVADATTPSWRAGTFSRVLLDAPCTGLGALRRRPELRWRRRPGDVDRLHELQVTLLQRAIEAVEPGGVVAYATCSPHLHETRDVVARVVNARADVEAVDARTLLPDVVDTGSGPHVQLWPHRHGTDAMYLAVVRRLPAEWTSGPYTSVSVS